MTMTRTDLVALAPLIVLGAAVVVLMLAIAWRRSHVGFRTAHWPL